MKFLLAPIRIIYCLYAFIIFLALMIIVVPLVFFSLPFGKITGGNFIFRLCTWWADIWFFLIGIYHKNIYEAPHDTSRQYIFVANHISYLDAPILVKTVRQHVRVLGKVEMSQIPIFGFIYKNAIVTVDRSDATKRANSVRILRSVIKRGISILMFPEGTFNETTRPLKDFYDGAFRIAIETQTPIKPVLFLDAYDRMHYMSILSLTPGISRSIFLEEIKVEGLTMKDVQMLKQKTFSIMESALVKYRASWIK
ncbi:MAG: 1-acyl-sn-glycerol-3-phosphate acyltransferase [Chitinophagaceae bacterium]|nr:1-acyl-sn-glycerol-3-phosphate acyltransferase [Chitinophagaceae bacterium]